MYFNVNLIQNKNLFLLFLTLACVSGIGAFFAPALIFLIVYYLKNKTELKKDIYVLKNFKISLIFMLLFLVCLLISWFITGGVDGLKLVRNNLERMLPFIFVLIGLAGNGVLEEKLKYILFGSCAGIWIVCSSVLHKIFILELSRPSSLLGSVNILGGTLILVFPFIVALTVKLRNEKNIFSFAVITSILLLCTLFVIKSRGAWLGLYIMLLVLPLLLYKIKQVTLKQALLIDLLLIGGAIAVYFMFYDSFHRGYDFERPALREIAWHMFLAHPIAGVGSGNFISTYANETYISPLVNSKHILTHAHNIYFKFLSENGILGLGGFIVLIVYQLKSLLSNIFQKRNILSLAMFLAISGMLAHGWFDVCFSARYYAMTYWLLWGITVYIMYFCKEEDKCSMAKLY